MCFSFAYLRFAGLFFLFQHFSAKEHTQRHVHVHVEGHTMYISDAKEANPSHYLHIIEIPKSHGGPHAGLAITDSFHSLSVQTVT